MVDLANKFCQCNLISSKYLCITGGRYQSIVLLAVLARRKLMYVDVILHCTQHSALTQPELSARSPKPKTPKTRVGWDVGTVVSLSLLLRMTKKFQNSKIRPNRIDTATYVPTYLRPMMAFVVYGKNFLTLNPTLL
jgi:hypothetical protein